MMPRLGIGYTFANTTEARPWPREGITVTAATAEGVWGQTIIQRWHFQSLAMKGFDSYRLCVTWSTHMDANLRIDPAWMNRVQQLVDYALDAGLYVILNTHHEEELYWMIRDGQMAQAERHLNAIWQQVAERFRDYPEQLLFEILNEPNLKPYYGAAHGDWVWRGHHMEDGQMVPTLYQPLIERVNQLNASALNVIRNSGGHNARRVVVLGVAGANPEAMYYTTVPANDPYIMLGFFGYGGGDDVRMQRHIQRVLDRGIAIVNKEDNTGAEWGATVHGHVTSQQFADITRRHMNWFAQRGIPTIWFAGCAGTGGELDDVRITLDDAFFDRTTGEWHNNAALRAIFTAFGRTLGPDFAPFNWQQISTIGAHNFANRANAWDGLDFTPAQHGMNLAANVYRIIVRGSVVNAPANTTTRVSLNGQDAPWFWVYQDVQGSGSFELRSTIGRGAEAPNMQQFANGFRVQTIGCTTSFNITEVIIERNAN
jgi:hypothetical protein